jgi:hypothetical protein
LIVKTPKALAEAVEAEGEGKAAAEIKVKMVMVEKKKAAGGTVRVNLAEGGGAGARERIAIVAVGRITAAANPRMGAGRARTMGKIPMEEGAPPWHRLPLECPPCQSKTRKRPLLRRLIRLRHSWMIPMKTKLLMASYFRIR